MISVQVWAWNQCTQVPPDSSGRPMRPSVQARPPMRSLASKISYSMPAVCSSRAATRPANPPPMMTTLFLDMIKVSFSLGEKCWWLWIGKCLHRRRGLGSYLRYLARDVRGVHGVAADYNLTPDKANEPGSQDDGRHDPHHAEVIGVHHDG